MSQGQWASQPTPRRKLLRQIIAKRRKWQVKQWDWLWKRAVGLFVAYAEPRLEGDRIEKDEEVQVRQG